MECQIECAAKGFILSWQHAGVLPKMFSSIVSLSKKKKLFNASKGVAGGEVKLEIPLPLEVLHHKQGDVQPLGVWWCSGIKWQIVITSAKAPESPPSFLGSPAQTCSQGWLLNVNTNGNASRPSHTKPSPTVLALANRTYLGLFPTWNFWWHHKCSCHALPVRRSHKLNTKSLMLPWSCCILSCLVQGPKKMD